MTNPLTPKQADREAAARNMDRRYGEGHWLAAEYRAGKHDHTDSVQAFAHHAQQARLEERERLGTAALVIVEHFERVEGSPSTADLEPPLGDDDAITIKVRDLRALRDAVRKGLA